MSWLFWLIPILSAPFVYIYAWKQWHWRKFRQISPEVRQELDQTPEWWDRQYANLLMAHTSPSPLSPHTHRAMLENYLNGQVLGMSIGYSENGVSESRLLPRTVIGRLPLVSEVAIGRGRITHFALFMGNTQMTDWARLVSSRTVIPGDKLEWGELPKVEIY